MPQPGADRNLLFGILALQMDFITREQLIAAMQSWVFDKTKPLGEILRAQHALAEDHRVLLEALVQKHLAKHGNDLSKSLAAVSSVGNIRKDLEQIVDAEVQASLGQVSMTLVKEKDPFATALPTTPPLSASGLRFRILRPHARGGLGQVYVAHDQELHREVALKEIQGRHADDQECRSRFLLEAEITGGLEHPGIVPVYGLGSYEDGRPYYAMRFIRGDSLKDAIERFHKTDAAGMSSGQRTLELRALLGRFIDVCNAIAYAHSRGVLHRDLKPGNIMLGKYGETLVVDWGLAKAMGGEPDSKAPSEPGEGSLKPASLSASSQTMMGSTVGTPQFMSPEQALGQLDQLGPPSDVYSLGATLYSLLTGQAPIQGKDVTEVLQKVQRGDIVPPRQHKSEIPLPLEAVCLKALALKPQDRYSTPRLLADDLEHWLADEPVSAWPEPWTVRARRWLSRHRLLVTAAASAAVVALVGLTVATVLLTAAHERERYAHAQAQQNFVLAREAVDRYCTDVSENVLLNEPGMQPLRKKLLEAAREYYEKFVEDHASDPAVQGELARALYRLAQITGDIDSERKAIPLQEQAIQRFEKLTATPAGAAYQSDLAASWHHLGRMQRLTDQLVPSEESYRKALPLWERLLRDDPQAERIQAGLARTQMGLGNVYQVTRRWDEAQKIDQQALDTRVALVKTHPDNAEYRRDLAVNYNDLAMVYTAAGKLHPEAESAYRQALKIQQRLVQDQPAVSQYQNDLARTHFNLGDLAAQTGDFKGAEAAYQDAAKIWQALSQRHPAVPLFEALQAEAHTALAGTHLKAHALAKAEASAQLALSLQRKLADKHRDKPSYQADLGRGYFSLAQVHRASRDKDRAEKAYEEAARIQQRLVQDLPHVPHYQSALARTYRGWGLLYEDFHQDDRAKEAFKKSLSGWEKLLKDHPDDPEFAQGLSSTFLEMGNLARSQGKLPDALAWYERAVESLDLKKFPQTASATTTATLGNAHWMRAEILTRLERYPEALTSWDQALALVKEGQKPALQLPRMLVLARTGKYLEATNEAGALSAKARSGDALYRFAAVYALAASAAAADAARSADERQGLADQFAGRAVQLLEQSAETGFFKMPSNRDQLKTDPDLQSLRGRSAFQELSSKVGAP